MTCRKMFFCFVLCLPLVHVVEADTRFVANMDASQSVTPSSNPAHGTCDAILNESQSELQIYCTHTVADPIGSHIHRAPTGQSGPIVFPLGPGQSPIEATWADPSASDINDLFAGNLYVNIHTKDVGEIRGQLLKESGSAENPVILYPHLALGAGFEVVLLASNTLTSTFDGTILLPTFGEGSDIPWLVNGRDMTGLDRFEVSIPPLSTARFLFQTLPGSGPFAGPLELHGDAGNPRSALATTFFYEYSRDGRLVDSIGIPSAQAGTRIVVPVELSSQSKLNTGVAIRTRDAEGSGLPDSIEVFLFDAQGGLVGQASGPFIGARFFTDLIPGIEAASGGEFLGSLRIEYTDELFVVALRQQLFDDGTFQLTGVPPLVLPNEEPSFAARYELVFDASWSAATHPGNFPPGPHFSGLIGGTHHTGGTFWKPGENASPGIRSMAETGSKEPLRSEVQAAIAQGFAENLISGGGIGTSPGRVAVSFDVTTAFPLVTAVSMIAPSPDWFVGVNGENMLVDGMWAEELIVDLFPFDAGTDSGSNYTSPDQPTVPAEAISSLEGDPFLKNGIVNPLGTFIFRRVR